MSSLALRRIKLYHRLNLADVVEPDEGNVCCATNLDDRVEDLELIDHCFDEATNLSESQRSSLYYISGYTTFNEQIEGSDHDIDDAGQSTQLVSRGLLKHPSPELYDLPLYIYTFFKNRKVKCCTKIFLQAFKFIY